MKKEKERKSVLYLTNVPTDLKAHFKAACAKRGRTMTDIINRLMKGYVTGSIKKYELL